MAKSKGRTTVKELPPVPVPAIENAAPVPTSEISGLTPGRMVHWVLAPGEHRPATVIKVVDGAAGLVNLHVLMDGANDGYAADSCGQWLEARQFDPFGAVNSWHFIERA